MTKMFEVLERQIRFGSLHTIHNLIDFFQLIVITYQLALGEYIVCVRPNL